MSADYFFASYARADKSKALDKFVKALRKEIGDLAGLNLQADEDLKLVGFFDTTSIETGDDWVKALGDGLRTCKVCVCLCTQTYFNREFCGKEYYVFAMRKDAWLKIPGNEQRQARVIIPVLWRVSSDPVPPAISGLQNPGDGFPDIYGQQGLEALAQNGGQSANFKKAVKKIAALVWDGIRDVQLPALDKLQPVDKIPSAFHGPTRYGAALAVLPPNGPRWKPYSKATICFETEAIASVLRVRLRTIAWDEQFVLRIEEASATREAVLLVADPIAVRSAAARATLGQLDARFTNFAVLIVWNDPAGQPQQDLDEVRAALAASCSKALADLRVSDAAIVGSEPLRQRISDSITKLRRKLIKDDPVVKAQDAQVEQLAREEGISHERAPVLSANPGGK